ncbi:GntR family transcriptional regulator [Lachnospiraceae bacterium NSJ-143]|nr:GntR family transcriptional regulator [Lachnospiraceae bacterium NSJ-143]
MRLDKGLYRLVYEFYEARIIYGFYVYGDRLPSIQKISAIFQMAPATVRSALSKLEKNGYISVEQRKAASVIYKCEPGQFRKNAAEYFVCRRDGIIDLIKSGKVLFEPLWEEGLRRWEDKDWEILTDSIVKNVSGTVSMSVKFYILAIGALNNRLALNLYWEMIRYIQFPYLGDIDEYKTVFPEFNACRHEEVLRFINSEFEASFGRAIDKLLPFIGQAEEDYGLKGAEQIPFIWNIYRQRPQMRYTLVSRLIHEIVIGKYNTGSFLPSLPQLAEKYDVSVNTVRRTLDIMEGLGIIKTCHGKGSFVCEMNGNIDFSKAEIREGLRLYRESLQILTITVDKVILSTLKCAGTEQIETLRKRLNEIVEKKHSYICFEVMFDFIDKNCGMQLVRECYEKLRELLTWGYPFVLIRLKNGSLNLLYSEIIAKMEHMLQNGCQEGFAYEWRKLMLKETQRLSEMFNSTKLV